MTPLSIEEVLEITEGQLLHGDVRIPFSGYTTDSRSVHPGNLYIPIVGRWYNGNDFIADVMAQGASWSLISDLSKIPLESNLDDQGLIFVDDTMGALQKLAAHVHVKRCSPAVTVKADKRRNSNKKMIAACLKTLQEDI